MGAYIPNVLGGELISPAWPDPSWLLPSPSTTSWQPRTSEKVPELLDRRLQGSWVAELSTADASLQCSDLHMSSEDFKESYAAYIGTLGVLFLHSPKGEFYLAPLNRRPSMRWRQRGTHLRRWQDVNSQNASTDGRSVRKNGGVWTERGCLHHQLWTSGGGWGWSRVEGGADRSSHPSVPDYRTALVCLKLYLFNAVK